MPPTFPGFISSLLGFLLGLRDELQEHHEKSVSPVVFSEHPPIHFADLTTYVNFFRGQGGEVLEAAILLLRRDESSSSRMSCKGDLIFMHALEPPIGVIWTSFTSRRMAGLVQSRPSSLAPSANGSCGRKSARITKTSRKGIGASRARVTSVSHRAQHPVGYHLRENCAIGAPVLLPWT